MSGMGGIGTSPKAWGEEGGMGGGVKEGIMQCGDFTVFGKVMDTFSPHACSKRRPKTLSLSKRI